MITVKAEFANQDHRLWPGRFVNVLVTLATDPNAHVVPAVAVQSGQLGDYVFVVKADQSVDYRKVTIDRTIGSSTVIREGLAHGRDGRHRRPAAADRRHARHDQGREEPRAAP